MIFNILQDFFAAFFAPVLFAGIGFMLVASIVLAVVTVIRAIRDA